MPAAGNPRVRWASDPPKAGRDFFLFKTAKQANDFKYPDLLEMEYYALFEVTDSHGTNVMGASLPVKNAPDYSWSFAYATDMITAARAAYHGILKMSFIGWMRITHSAFFKYYRQPDAVDMLWISYDHLDALFYGNRKDIRVGNWFGSAFFGSTTRPFNPYGGAMENPPEGDAWYERIGEP